MDGCSRKKTMISQNDVPTKPNIVLGHKSCYTLEERLTGQNAVFRSHTPDGTPCIVKVYSRGHGSRPEPYHGYHRERHALEIIRKAGCHQNLLSPIECIEDMDNGPSIVFPFIAGKTLSDYSWEKEDLCDRDLAGIIALICDALQFMHEQGLVHRDVKADNIRIGYGNSDAAADGNGILGGITPYLLDFDITYHKGVSHLERPGIVPGTLTHIAPEIWKDQAPDPRADIYAFGITLYGVVTRKMPVMGKVFGVMEQHLFMPVPDPLHDNKEVSDGMRTIIMTCLQKDPNDRYQSAAEIKRDVEQLCR